MVCRKVCVAVALVFFCSNVFAQVVSDFATDFDGWTAPDALAGSFQHSPTGGNPDGYITGQTPGSIPVGAGLLWVPFLYQAPSQFEGDKSAYYNGNLRYDVSQTTSGPGLAYPQVIMTSNAGVSLWYYPATPVVAPAFGTWANLDVKLTAVGGRWKTTNSPTGTGATVAQLQAVLGDIATLQITGLYTNANVASRIDNVTMYPPIIINAQPQPRNACDGDIATFTTEASNNPDITYHWQHYDSTLGWLDMADGGGYSGVTTNELAVNTAGMFGAGGYRSRIMGTAVDEALTFGVALQVYERPAPPTTTGAGSCDATSLTLTAAGGAAGFYRWYTDETGSTQVNGEVNDTYVTPELTVPTIYYVVITDFNCESTRTPVLAQIGPPEPPAVTGASSCSHDALTLTASGGTDGQYRWYAAETGGTPIDGETGATFETPELDETASYYVSLASPFGACESARVEVVANIDLPQPPTTTGASSCTPAAILLTASGGAGGQYRWYTQENGGSSVEDSRNYLTPVLSATTTYYVAINNGICESERTAVVATIGGDNCAPDPSTLIIEVFNAVSPNKDGKNDVFFIRNIDVIPNAMKNHVTIFNRWGDLVWEGNDYNNTSVVFTGLSKNNTELPSGTYYYKIEFLAGGATESGYLSLKR